MNPRITAERSLADILKADKSVLSVAFLMANESSLPANNPTKHQVVDIGILDHNLKTKSTMAKIKSTNVASGTSLTRDFSSTTL